MRQAVKDGDAISLGSTSTSGLKGSLRENNEGCFLVAEAIIAQAAIRAITTSPRHSVLFWEEWAGEKQDISLCFGLAGVVSVGAEGFLKRLSSVSR